MTRLANWLTTWFWWVVLMACAVGPFVLVFVLALAAEGRRHA